MIWQFQVYRYEYITNKKHVWCVKPHVMIMISWTVFHRQVVIIPMMRYQDRVKDRRTFSVVIRLDVRSCNKFQLLTIAHISWFVVAGTHLQLVSCYHIIVIIFVGTWLSSVWFGLVRLGSVRLGLLLLLLLLFLFLFLFLFLLLLLLLLLSLFPVEPQDEAGQHSLQRILEWCEARWQETMVAIGLQGGPQKPVINGVKHPYKSIGRVK